MALSGPTTVTAPVPLLEMVRPAIGMTATVPFAAVKSAS